MLVFFKHFASKNQLPGFYVSGTLVGNGLILFLIAFFINFEFMVEDLKMWKKGAINVIFGRTETIAFLDME